MYLICQGNFIDIVFHGYCATEEEAKKYCEEQNAVATWGSFWYREMKRVGGSSDVFESKVNEIEELMTEYSLLLQHEETVKGKSRYKGVIQGLGLAVNILKHSSDN